MPQVAENLKAWEGFFNPTGGASVYKLLPLRPRYNTTI